MTLFILMLLFSLDMSEHLVFLLTMVLLLAACGESDATRTAAPVRVNGFGTDSINLQPDGKGALQARVNKV